MRPGILLILADELPAFMLGSYGNRQVRTPNLDVLAQMGTRFTNHFFLRAQRRGGPAIRCSLAVPPMQLGGDGGALSPADVTLTKVLGDAGYACQEGDATAALQFLDGQSAGKPFFFTLNCPSLRPPYDNAPKQFLDMYATEPFDGYAPDLPAASAADGKGYASQHLGQRPEGRRRAWSALDASVKTRAR
ncbi:MAG: hypothetical protein WDO73_26135 [Ignavibacteriota bacterium]